MMRQHSDASRTETGGAGSPVRKKYEPPKLRRFGRLEEITLGASQNSADNGGKRGLAYK
jgi:hypothetical protein